MNQKSSHLVWLQDPPNRFDLLITGKERDIEIQNNFFSWIDFKASLDFLSGLEESIFIVDVETESQVILLKSSIIPGLKAKQIVFFLTPMPQRSEVKEFIQDNEHFYRFLKPVRKSELLVCLQKTLMLRCYKNELDARENEDLVWLRRIENVFELSRNELLEKEKTNIAYEHLIEYEEALLNEQKKINFALMELHEFKDKTKAEWQKEKKARETLENMYSQELMDKDKTLAAQEQLLDYSYREKEVFRKVLDEFKREGVLPKDKIEMILKNQQSLIEKIERFLN